MATTTGGKKEKKRARAQPQAAEDPSIDAPCRPHKCLKTVTMCSKTMHWFPLVYIWAGRCAYTAGFAVICMRI